MGGDVTELESFLKIGVPLIYAIVGSSVIPVLPAYLNGRTSLLRACVVASLWPLWLPGAVLTKIGRKLVDGWAWSMAVAIRDGLWDALRLAAGRGLGTKSDDSEGHLVTDFFAKDCPACGSRFVSPGGSAYCSGGCAVQGPQPEQPGKLPDHVRKPGAYRPCDACGGACLGGIDC